MPPPRKDPFPHLSGDLMADASAGDLAQLFKVLANDNRLRILHVIYLAGEVSPSDIAEAIGASQQAVSNQLQRLADQRIVHARRDGQRVLYQIIDPCVPGLMDLGVCLMSQRE
ncbi:MAG: winged helix-turn-helix transcriptional regulator [Acidimicrobiia bacterium]|nr:winged helix-turn-helix transcriptional regulator [Acidimicrobiia bacterium]